MDIEEELFKALADKTRLRLMRFLLANGETCVNDLAKALDEPTYKISRHLTILRNTCMLETRKKGTWVFYKPTNGALVLQRAINDILSLCSSLPTQKNNYIQDSLHDSLSSKDSQL